MMTWEDLWAEGDTGWDAGKSSPALVKLAANPDLKRGRALVPGCGSGYDVFKLAAAGWNATGIDLAPTAAKRFEALRRERGLSAEQAAIEVGSFFDYEPSAGFDLIWDYTFFCAIEPEMRSDWAQTMDRLLADGGELWTLIFPVDENRSWDQGPPYRLSVDLVRAVLEPRFTMLSVEEIHDSHPGREGKEWLARWTRAAKP